MSRRRTAPLRALRLGNLLCGMAAAGALCVGPLDALAWGDEGHEVVALIGAGSLSPGSGYGGLGASS